jgi:hypothetical protein
MPDMGVVFIGESLISKQPQATASVPTSIQQNRPQLYTVYTLEKYMFSSV